MNLFSKLVGSFAIIAAICGVVGGIGWYGISSIQGDVSEVAEVRLPAVHGIGLMIEAMNAIKASERTMVIAGITYRERRLELSNLEFLWGEFDKGLDIYRNLPKTSEEAALVEHFLTELAKWKEVHRQVAELITRVGLDDVQNLESILVAHRLEMVKWFNELQKSMNDNEMFAGRLDGSQTSFGRWLEQFDSDDERFQTLINSLNEPYLELFDQARQINTFIDEEKVVKAIVAFNKELSPTFNDLEMLFDKALAEVKSEIKILNEAVAIVLGSEKLVFDSTMTAIDEINRLNVTMTSTISLHAKEKAIFSKTFSLIAVLLGVIIALVFGYYTAHKISRPMGKTAEMIMAMEQGHLDGRLHMDRHDEIGDMAKAMDRFADYLQNVIVKALQKLADNDLTFDPDVSNESDVIGKALEKAKNDLNRVISNIRLASDNISSGARQVADASQVLSQGATEQASSLEEISSSIAEMGSQASANAENANQANQLSEQAKNAAESGNKQMQEMIVAMDDINEASRHISKIIKVIDEIAFQTNLLALNAAVEAARAGKHGRGFAVVAEEVRNLAARSAKAARETSELIESSVAKAKNGSEIANQTAAALGEIVEGVTRTAGLVFEIAKSSNEQAQGIFQINNGLEQIEKVTQQNTANAEECAAAAEQLSSQAAEMKQQLAGFKLVDSIYSLSGHDKISLPGDQDEAEVPKQAALDAPA